LRAAGHGSEPQRKQLNRPVLTSRADLAEAVVQRANEAEILDAARQFGLGGFRVLHVQRGRRWSRGKQILLVCFSIDRAIELVRIFLCARSAPISGGNEVFDSPSLLWSEHYAIHDERLCGVK